MARVPGYSPTSRSARAGTEEHPAARKSASTNRSRSRDYVVAQERFERGKIEAREDACAAAQGRSREGAQPPGTLPAAGGLARHQRPGVTSRSSAVLSGARSLDTICQSWSRSTSK